MIDARRRVALLAFSFPAFLLSSVCLPAVAGAASPAAIRSDAERLGAEWDRIRQSGGGEAERGLIERLGALVLDLIDRVDDAVRTGDESEGVRAPLRAAFEAIHRPLNGIYSGASGTLERQAREIMDADGDLEALYETPAWQQNQRIAAEALYYLNWLNLYGARVSDGARRKELLEAAERGFSEFAVGERKDELITESLLGRGLCHLELGNTEWAVRDFKIVIDAPDVSAERKDKARMAMLDAYARGKNFRETLRYSKQLLAGGQVSGGDATVVRFIRLQALFDGVEKAPGEADTYRREAGALMEQLRRAGPGWAGRVEALMLSRIDDPAKWVGKAESPQAKWELARMLLAKGDERSATPLLEAIVESESGEAKPFRSEASYWLGVARFKAEDYVGAAGLLEKALADPKPDFASEAAYLRFKSLEALMAREPTPELGKRYEAALTELLEKYGKHPKAYEARYRLGELKQAAGEFDAAIAEYAQVTGDPGFEVRARFGTLQSEFELLKATDADGRAARLQKIGAALDAYLAKAKGLDAKKVGDVPLEEFNAKTALMQAVYLGLAKKDADNEIVAALADFEKRYAEQKELFPQAVRLRLAAFRNLARWSDADALVVANAQALRDNTEAEKLDALAASFAKAGSLMRARGDAAGAKAADQVAVRLYEVVGEADDTPDSRRLLGVARLYESTGDMANASTTYGKILEKNASSLAALGGLARVAEAQKDLPAARGYWERYTSLTKPGDAPWYRGQFEQARVSLAAGQREQSCAILDKLKPAMPGLSDKDLRRDLGALYEKACG